MATRGPQDLIFAGRGQEEGVWVRGGVGGAGAGRRCLLAEEAKAPGDDTKSPGLCRVLKFSPDGRYFAYCAGRLLRLLPVTADMGSAKALLEAELPRTSQLVFSPKTTFLATFQPYAVYSKDKNAEGEPNLRVWDIATGKLVKSFIQRKTMGWEPQWSDDESVCCRLVGSEVLFHTKEAGLDKYSAKFVGEKVESVSLSPGSGPLHFAAYKPVAKGQPGIISIVAYPAMNIVANKTFWKADRVSLHWNKTGTSVIVMAITDVDASGKSYYGEQTLYLIGTDGESCMVPLGKKGPIYSVQWSPRANGFAVVYGYMPAKATLYNVKGEPVFDFGTGARNEAHYNAFGTILCLCGFGNLRGNMEFWSVRDRRLIKQTKAEDTTQFQWAPDGEHFITATTAPRLRVNNGWKLWHYAGSALEEWKAGTGKEFWEATWCPDPAFTADAHKVVFPPATPPISPVNGADAGLHPLEGHAAVRKGAYVPPHLRGDAAGQARAKKFTIHDNEAPMRLPEGGRGRGRGGGGAKGGRPGEPGPPTLDAAEDRAKKIRNLQKKIEQIKVLKHRQTCGETLEVNQLDKIKKEGELCKELENLELS